METFSKIENKKLNEYIKSISIKEQDNVFDYYENRWGKMKIEDILENNYLKRHDSIEDVTWYEKEIKDDNFKNIYLIKIYDKYGHFEVRVQFQKNDYVMNIQIFNICKHVTISDIEKEIKLVWNSLQRN